MWDRAVFLDRDNTIIENDGYLGDPAKVKLLPGAGTALVAMRALGYRLIVVSNQSGVARGMFNEAAVEAVNQEMSRQLQEQAGAYIDASYYCPYHPEAPIAEYRVDHDWRKPKAGMLKQAATDFGLDLAQSWMIGDQNRDVGAGAAAGCRTILLRDPELKGATETDTATSVSPNFVVRTLADAARILAREGRNPPAVAGGVGASPVADLVAKSAEPMAAPAVAETPRTVDEGAIAERVAEKLARHLAGQAAAPVNAGGNAKLERVLEELVVQIRTQNRHADLRPDFSYSNMGAIILQVFAVAALILGLQAYFRAPVNFTNASSWIDFFLAQFAREAAMIWLLVGVILQGMVVALLVRARNKH